MFAQALAERDQELCIRIRRPDAEESDYRHRRLLRSCRERPSRRAAEQRDELAAFHLRDHSITSSAVICMIIGTVRPSAFAVLRLMTRSNFVGCTTGRSPGLVPLRIRPT